MKSFPWDSVATAIGDDGYPVYDRAYAASDLREVYETFFSEGYFADEGGEFAVTPADGMKVNVAPGKCHIRGTVGYEDGERTLALEAAGSSDRIDTVVLRWDASVESRSIDFYIVKGAESTGTPQRPQLTREETVWELGLCDIYVPKFSTSVASDRITDTRLEKSRCGVVTPLIEVDTTSFFNQVQASVSKAVDLANDAMAGSIPGNLQAQIDGMWERIYPVGSYYISDNSTSPAQLFGGEWEQVTGAFLRAANDNSTGGSDTVTLTTANLPSHTHTGPSHYHSVTGTAASAGSHTHTIRQKYNGGSSSVNVYQIVDNLGGSSSITYTNSSTAVGYAGAHTHTVSGTAAAAGTGNTGATGSGSSFSNMPRYQDAYVWKRVA